MKSLRAKMTLLVLLLGTPFLVASVLTILAASEHGQLQERKSLAKRALNRLSRELQGENPRSRIGELYDQSGLDALGAGAALVDRDGTVLWESPTRVPKQGRKGVQQFRLDEGALLYVMPERPTTGSLGSWVWAIAGAGTLVYGVGAWLLVGATLKPISRLVSNVHSAKSSDGVTVSAPSTDAEIVRLVETLNDLIAEIRSESEERVKSYATLSHELRTPIHALLLKLDLALGSEQSKEELEATLVEVQGQVYRLNKLSEAVLTLQGLTQRTMTEGDGKPQPASHSLESVVHRILDELQPLLEVRSVSVDVRFEGDSTVKAVPQHTELLLRNLLENAAKFAPTGSEVTVTGLLSDQGLRVEVSNLAGEDRLAAGNGLGLRICHEIARVNGWELDTSERDGRFSARVRL